MSQAETPTLSLEVTRSIIEGSSSKHIMSRDSLPDFHQIHNLQELLDPRTPNPDEWKDNAEEMALYFEGVAVTAEHYRGKDLRLDFANIEAHSITNFLMKKIQTPVGIELGLHKHINRLSLIKEWVEYLRSISDQTTK